MNLWKKVLAALAALCLMAGASIMGSAASLSVPITPETFPDPAFLHWVEGTDTDGDGLLSQSERDAVTDMDLRKLGIQDLTGVEWFRALETLNCSENDLLSLELTDFPALRSLTCSENPRLENLTLSGTPALEHLYCFHSNLSLMDLHGVPDLTYLVWGGSPLQELDLSGNPNLHTLHVLGGNLLEADLSHNEKLDTLLWNHTWIGTLDLSHQPDLTYLNCTDNQLTSLDLSHNTKLETLYAGSNRLLAIQVPSDSLTFCDLTGQRPAAFTLPANENGFLLRELVPWMEPSQVSQFNGGTLYEDRVQLDAPNQTITYRYTDGAAVLDASVAVTGENSWLVPLHIASWTYGAPAASPQAQAAFGTVAFSYAPSADGPFEPAPPTHAGTWYVQALVEASPQCPGLEDIVSFQIYPAIPEYPTPGVKSATYGDALSDIALDSRFFWENSTLLAGDAGEQTHLALYVPEDSVDYQVVEHIPVRIHVSPYDGTRLPIPQLSSRPEAEALVIRHGDRVLQKGTDYVTSFEHQGNTVQFTILFRGNYTGTVVQTFSTGGGSDGSSSGGGGTVPSPSFVISAQATAGGTITPTGSLRVSQGATPLFTMQAQDGYRLEAVLVDGKSIGPEERYRFAPVTKDHTISAEFVPLEPSPPSDETGVSTYLDTQNHIAYVSGYPENRFGPDDPLTRAQAAQLFYSLLKDQNVPITAGFSDVPDDAWYARAVNTLASLGKVSGVGENRFLPDQTISRAEFVAMATAFAHPSPGPACSFPDVTPEDWFYEAVVSAADYGWISGYPDGSFGPGLLVTRGEASAILNRMLGRHADRDFITGHTGLRTFSDVSPSHWAYGDICEAANPHSYRQEGQTERWESLLE